MSSSIVSPSATPTRPAPCRESARVRLATVQSRLRLATEALAAADLLLGLNFGSASGSQAAAASTEEPR